MMKDHEKDYSVKESFEQFEESRRLFHKGDQLHYENNKSEAVTKYREAMRATVEDGFYYHLAQGQIYKIYGQMEDALTEFEIASSINDDIPEVHVNLGLTYRKISGLMKKYNMLDRAQELITESLASFDRALAINPHEASIYATMAMTYLKIGKSSLPNAEACAQKALQLDPDDYDGHNVLAQVRQRQGDISSARSLALRAISLKPNRPFAYGLMGTRGSAQTEPLEPKPAMAIDWLQKALERDPGNSFMMDP